MRAFATLLAFAASALAYSVTAPTNATGFSNEGSNFVSWTMVSTDAANFSIVLVNKNIFPNYQQELAALVVGSDGNTTVSPPSTGWPAAGVAGYQINLVASATQLDTILAQSDDFTFHTSTSSSSSSGSASGSSSSGSQSTTGLTLPATLSNTASTSASAPASSGSASGESSLNPSTSNTAITTTQTGAASPAAGVQAAFFGAVALLGALLA